MQCSLDDVPGEEVAMVTFTEQPPVGVVELDDCCGGSLTSKPEVPPEGVEDTSSDDHCGNARHGKTPFHPQSDGQVERFNATLQKILATTGERCHWDIMIMQ